MLVADDDESVRTLLAEILAGEGYRVVTASDGAEALEKMRATEPDLVILDLMMPHVSGWQVLEEIERHPRWAGTPVVVLTAFGEVGGVPAGRRVIHKPVDLELLRTTLEEMAGPAVTAGEPAISA